MSVTSFSGPVLSSAGFQVGTEAAPVSVIDSNGAFTRNGIAAGGAGSLQSVLKQVAAIAQATATDILTVTVPNVSAGAGGRIVVTSVITQTGHIGDSTRTVEYLWTVTRVAGAAAVITISIITGGSVIATSAAGYTLTSTLAASAVTGAVGATNTFTFQITNTGSTSSTTTATILAECLNTLAGGVTIA